jgi:branched-chain amino acid transport system ATP-binding protein
MAAHYATAPMLEVEGVAASYGGPNVISDINLTVNRGEVVALLGPNGAGKTTLLNAISGIATLTAGRIMLAGRPINGLAVHKVVQAGVAHVPQGRRLFAYATAYENLLAGGYVRSDREQLRRDADKFAHDWPLVERIRNRKGALLSGGEQQVIAFGRGVMSRPRLLLLDEPSLGLAPVLVDQLFDMIGTVVSDLEGSGMGVLLVEQNVRKALAIAQRAVVLVNGRILHTGATSDLTPERVVALYMGRAT